MTTYFRTCETCHKGINEGYIIEDGAYCSLACAGWTEAEWNAAYSDDGDNYWTEWEDEPSEEAEAYNALAKTIGSINGITVDDEAITKMVQHILDEEHN